MTRTIYGPASQKPLAMETAAEFDSTVLAMREFKARQGSAATVESVAEAYAKLTGQNPRRPFLLKAAEEAVR